ncbi:hypothetical protein GKE82_26510 [Conexibacter sp. W3-3-2]|uniref:hypothetical protein n=1 Tax=Conexibacter sp. W3-3-2 TaxID=2675227 RepID=UPI0012B86C92|nr:hypothetical protein [Conexibacter sp. W3-3-2]MTD47753.1 hypothetical protein [Conexibacter sp. W3-3-2]
MEQLLPPLRQTLALAPALAGTGVPALRSTTSAVRSAAPIFRGLRAYILDVLRGLATGIGPAAGYYDANGHYARVVANLDIPG